MKRYILSTLCLMAGMSLEAQVTESAIDAVKHMGVGWNLGNTLDASGHSASDFTQDAYWGGQGLESETMWGQPETTEPLFAMMRKAGFGAIRVPVTWFNHMAPDGTVDAAWMQRVHTVVDYVIDNDLYCILNVHHDTGADDTGYQSWIKADEGNFAANQQRYERLWQQIAEEFRDYDQRLLFESYNEMLDVKSSWCFASFQAPGNYDATLAATAYAGLNAYAQSFVNTVRATGGNNASRNLVVNTYAASNGYGSWNTHLIEPLTKMALPQDIVEGHLIFEVHAYPAIGNSNGTNRSLRDIKNEVDGMISVLNTHLVSKGAPVIFGEWGTSSVDNGAGRTDYDVRRELMLQFVDYFVRQTKASDMGTFYWMGMSDGLYRSMPAFTQPDLAECAVKAYHGDDFVGEYPSVTEIAEIVCFDGDKVLGWGNGININAAPFADLGDEVQLVLDYSQEGADDDIQLFFGDWSRKASFVVDGKSFDGDLQPSSYYGTPIGTEHQTVLSFDKATASQLAQKGLIIHGNGIRLFRAVLRDGSKAGIDAVQGDLTSDGQPTYNLFGQSVSTAGGGLYITGGHKVWVR